MLSILMRYGLALEHAQSIINIAAPHVELLKPENAIAVSYLLLFANICDASKVIVPTTERSVVPPKIQEADDCRAMTGVWLTSSVTKCFASFDDVVNGCGGKDEMKLAAAQLRLMTSFLSNSFENRQPHPRAVFALFCALSLILSLWLRGRFWRYTTLLGFEGVIALLVVLAFPVMEMILESIVEEKMRKVGEKIRAHDVRMREMLKRKKQTAAEG